MLAARTAIRRVALGAMVAPTGYSQALSQSQDFGDVVTANQFAGSVIRNDANIMLKLEQTKAQVEGQKNDIATHEASIVKARNAQAAELQQIANLQNEQASVRAQQASLRLHQNHLLLLVNAQRVHYLRQIQELQRENSLLSAIIRGAQRGQRVIQVDLQGTPVNPISWL